MKSVIIAIVMFLFLILIHEFGHFIVAKKSGIKVNEFAIGMGPKIFSTQKGETTYSLNLLPIGGYCAMEGEDENSDDPRSYNNVSAVKRFLTILAGPMMNFIFAALVFAFIIAINGKASTKIGTIADKSPAQVAGFKEGDEIISIGGQEVNKFEDVSANLKAYYKDKDKNEEIEVVVKRDSEEVKANLVANFEAGYPIIGVTSKLEKAGLLESIIGGFKEVGKNIFSMIGLLASLFSGAVSVSALSGPVGVVRELGNQASLGTNNLLYFFAYISVNLGFFNLLPIPALDGSKLITSLYEMITGKAVNRKIEQTATIVGFVLLMGLILAITVKDVLAIF